MLTVRAERLYVIRYRSLEHRRQVLSEFIGRYNQEWLLERHGYMTTADARELSRVGEGRLT